jgi:hypothetical protein
VPPPVKQVYKPKERKEMQMMEVDPERTTSQDIIQIGSMDVLIGEDGKRPIVPNNKVVTSIPEVATNDHEASGSSSNSKYFLPRWCPPGLTHTQRRKLQRLRFEEKREKELEKQRDEAFNQYMSYGPPWAHYLGGYQDRLLGGPLGLPDLCRTVPVGVRRKDYGGEVLR